MYVQSLRSSPSSREAPHPRLFAFLSILCSSESVVLGAGLATHLASIYIEKPERCFLRCSIFWIGEKRERKSRRIFFETSFSTCREVVGLNVGALVASCARLPLWIWGNRSCLQDLSELCRYEREISLAIWTFMISLYGIAVYSISHHNFIDCIFTSPEQHWWFLWLKNLVFSCHLIHLFAAFLSFLLHPRASSYKQQQRSTSEGVPFLSSHPPCEKRWHLVLLNFFLLFPESHSQTRLPFQHSPSHLAPVSSSYNDVEKLRSERLHWRFCDSALFIHSWWTTS